MEYKFRTLEANEIDCRVNTINENGLTLLLYKDARVDMNILDETVGSENWQRDHKELKGNIYCGIGIWDDKKQQWIWKWDCGSESNVEKEKGEASDSFKRTCVNVGIGKELYTAPFIYIPLNDKEGNPNFRLLRKNNKLTTNDKFYVEAIKYNDERKIVGLAIKNGNKRVFVYAER